MKVGADNACDFRLTKTLSQTDDDRVKKRKLRDDMFVDVSVEVSRFGSFAHSTETLALIRNTPSSSHRIQSSKLLAGASWLLHRY